MPHVYNLTPFNRSSTNGERETITKEFVFNGQFTPGDIIVIDCENKIVSHNGINVSHLFVGDFFNLNYGENTITWSDELMSRNINMEISYRV
ncbi:phage distal tail protein [Paenibacillus sp. JSM ZJ436]|uniref:phage distal tail protein n=1 Tax=Paenibacillus sp. JSM ZJ436 TaxID=3376190 RepID=UPI0037896D6A